MTQPNTCEIHTSSLRLMDPLLTAEIKSSNSVYELYTILRDSFKNNNFLKYMQQPQKMMQNHTGFSTVTREIDPDLEIKVHAVWATNPKDPKGVNKNIDNFIAQSKKVPGETILWTNIDKNTLLTLSPELKNTEITIKHISEINTQYKDLLELALNPKIYFNPGVGRYYNAYIVDLIKDLVIESNGGILVDLNFKFGKYFTANNLKNHDFQRL
jgi:hypothetical protein